MRDPIWLLPDEYTGPDTDQNGIPNAQILHLIVKQIIFYNICI